MVVRGNLDYLVERAIEREEDGVITSTKHQSWQNMLAADEDEDGCAICHL